MTKAWVLVAESARARLFSIDSPTGPLHEIHAMVHVESRMHEQDLTSDLPGRDANPGGSAHHGVEPEMSAKEHEALVFAKQVVAYLEQARQKGSFEKLIIAAAPKFLGHLRSEMPGPLSALVDKQVDKNISQESPERIRELLPEWL